MNDALTIVNNEAAHRFETRIGEDIAIAEYKMEPDGIRFYHTLVPEALGGRGIGKALIRAGLKHARDNGLMVKPQCPFFAAYMKEHAEEHDLVHPDWRAKIGIAP